jgi:hypothetical protein
LGIHEKESRNNNRAHHQALVEINFQKSSSRGAQQTKP